MERENGSTLKVTYSLNIKSGTAALYWLGSTDEHIILGDKEEHMIAEVTDEDVYEFTFNAGDNFIVLKGDEKCWHCRIHNVLLSIQRKVIDKGCGYRFIGKIRVGSRYLGTGVSIGSFVCRSMQKNCRWQFSCIVDDRVEIICL